LGNAYPKLLRAVGHDETLIRLIEDICNARADVVEKPNRIPKEVSRPENDMYLSYELLGVVISHVLDQVRNRNAGIFKDESVQSNWSIINIANRHCQDIV